MKTLTDTQDNEPLTATEGLKLITDGKAVKVGTTYDSHHRLVVILQMHATGNLVTCRTVDPKDQI